MNYTVYRANYGAATLTQITAIRYERDFVLFFDMKGLKVAFKSDTITRIDRT